MAKLIGPKADNEANTPKQSERFNLHAEKSNQRRKNHELYKEKS